MVQAALAEKIDFIPTARYRLNTSEFKNTLHTGHDWVAEVKHGVPLEAVLTDEFWQHIPSAHAVQIGQFIRAMCVDQSYLAILWVVDKGPNYIKVDPVLVHRREAVTDTGGSPAPSGYRVEWKGITDKFTVIRESDQTALRKGFKDKGPAYGWINEHVKAFKKA
jgi:hypothetical protein